jgi:hypothetical protein
MDGIAYSSDLTPSKIMRSKPTNSTFTGPEVRTHEHRNHWKGTAVATREQLRSDLANKITRA